MQTDGRPAAAQYRLRANVIYVGGSRCSSPEKAQTLLLPPLRHTTSCLDDRVRHLTAYTCCYAYVLELCAHIRRTEQSLLQVSSSVTTPPRWATTSPSTSRLGALSRLLVCLKNDSLHENAASTTFHLRPSGLSSLVCRQARHPYRRIKRLSKCSRPARSRTYLSLPRSSRFAQPLLHFRFKNVVTFNMDEYVGLPQDHPESYHTFMFREFFSHGALCHTSLHVFSDESTSRHPADAGKHPQRERGRPDRRMQRVRREDHEVRRDRALPRRNWRRRSHRV
jgi:hypothetical protein